jgi:hypothetical protein
MAGTHHGECEAEEPHAALPATFLRFLLLGQGLMRWCGAEFVVDVAAFFERLGIFAPLSSHAGDGISLSRFSPAEFFI